MKELFLIDVGTSTVKVYKKESEKVDLIEQKTFHFQDGFTKKQGLSNNNRIALFDYFQGLIDKYSLTNYNTKLYATGIFRDIENKGETIKNFFKRTGLYFNIISHNLEAFYLEKAWVNKECDSINGLVVINIGGKTTEVLLYNNGIIEKVEKLSFGIGKVLKKYQEINDYHSKYNLDYIVSHIYEDISKQLSAISFPYKIAIYTGGELNYMKCAQYPLTPNTFFNDSLHPYMIQTIDYRKRNNDIFTKLSIKDLKTMMPNDPDWMLGARACSALAQAICQFYKVEFIIPSDANLIDGVNVQEAQNVVLCGSFNKHLNQIKELICKLNKNNINVSSPKSTEVTGEEDGFVLFKNDVVENHNTWAVEEKHLKAIDDCDFVIACNYDDYIGISTTFELDYAFRKNKKIVFIEDNDSARTFGKRIGQFPMPCEIGII